MLECLPGCKYVTMGGMIANNIHGKLLKSNSIINNVISFKIINSKYKLIECSRRKNKELFFLTVGGRGCTGPIISIKFKLSKLPSKIINQRFIHFNSKKNFLDNLKKIKKKKICSYLVGFFKKKF